MKLGVKKCLIILGVLTLLPSNVAARRGCCSHHGGVRGDCRYGKQVCNDGTTSPSCICESEINNTEESNSSQSRNYNYNPIISGCTDSNAINYNPKANRDDGSCIKKIYGCTDINAYNYKEDANVDDGSCIAKNYGCMDKKANNYKEEANTKDGSCLYTEYKTSYQKIKYKTKHKYKFFTKEGKVLQKGKNGKKKIVKEVIVNEKKEIVETLNTKTEIIKKPITKIIATKKKNKKKVNK